MNFTEGINGNDETASKQKHQLAIGASLTVFGAGAIAFMLFGGSAIEEWQKGIAKTPPSAFDPLILWSFLGPTLFIISVCSLIIGTVFLYSLYHGEIRKQNEAVYGTTVVTEGAHRTTRHLERIAEYLKKRQHGKNGEAR